MASTRVQLTADELDILVTLLPMQHYKLKAKLQKALVIAGGRAVNNPSGYDLFSSTSDGASNQLATQSASNMKIESIMNKMLNDIELTDEEREYYSATTGIQI